MLDHLLHRRWLAHGAVAALTVGLAGLAMVSVESYGWTSATTTRVRSLEAASDAWDHVSVRVMGEHEALTDYLGTYSAAGRLRAVSALGSARPSLLWIEGHGGRDDTRRAKAMADRYDVYTASLAQVLQINSENGGSTTPARGAAAGHTAVNIGEEAANNAARDHQELAGYLDQIEHRNGELRMATLTLVAGDLALLVLCLWILLVYRRRAEEEAKQRTHRALHDGLTGIPNRTLLVDRLGAVVRLAERQQTSIGLLLLDLDRFKEVNDTLGHQHGDALLCEIADRLTRTIRASDTVARLGGDEFAVLLNSGGSLPEALEVAQRVLNAVRQPVCLDGLTTEVGCSIGVAIYPEHGSAPTDLFKNADIAMYVAKRGHLGVAVYSPEADRYTSEQLVILGELRYAIDTDELVLFYQPKVHTATGQVCGVEALVRWQHPTRGLLGPQEFIPVAERTELMSPLTDYVITAALEQQRLWMADGLPMQVSVNIGADSLLDSQFPDRVADLLAASHARAELVTLEITETAFISDETCALKVAERLRELGVQLALDDFGTGYSSMAHLQKMPVDELKIDRRFVTDLLVADRDKTIAQAIVDIAHSLGMRVVGEGVEDAATLEALRDLDCDEAQGYYLCRPVPAPEFEKWLTQRKHGTHPTAPVTPSPSIQG